MIEGKPEIVEFLLAHGADWAKRDRSGGFTPLMAASVNCVRSARRHFSGRAIRDSRKIVAALRAAGATDPETEYILGNESDEAALLAGVARLRPSPESLVENLDGPRQCKWRFTSKLSHCLRSGSS